MPAILRYLGISLTALALALVQFPSVAQNAQPNAREKLATYTKPAIVRVVNGCFGFFPSFYQGPSGTDGIGDAYASYGVLGSGFFITPDGYIATYGIISDIDCEKELTQQLIGEGKKLVPFDSNRPDIKPKIEHVRNVILPSPNPESRQEPLEFKLPSDDSKNASIIKIELDKENAPSLKFGESEKVGLDDVTLVGYAVGAKDNKALKDTEAYEASVSDGRISNDSRKLADNSPAFEISASGSYYAGSPVLNEQGEVIGIITPTEKDKIRYVNEDEVADGQPSNASELALAIPAKAVQKLLTSRNIVNSQGEIDGWYRSGLELFWQGDYASAKEKFEVVKDLFPQHSEVDRLISESNKGRVNQFSKPNFAFWGAIAAAGAAVLGLIFALMRRKPKTARKSSGDVRPFSKPAQTGVSKTSSINAQAWIELEGRGEMIKLPLYKDTHRIGRDPAWSDVEMPASWEVLSRQHAILKREGDSYRIFDGDGKVASRNGLLVDDYDRVDTTVGHLLRPGDTIAIGKNPLEQVRITYFNAASGQASNETKMA